jgi:hypothetical protein
MDWWASVCDCKLNNIPLINNGEKKIGIANLEITNPIKIVEKH